MKRDKDMTVLVIGRIDGKKRLASIMDKKEALKILKNKNFKKIEDNLWIDRGGQEFYITLPTDHAPGKEKNGMIYTVFPKDESYPPQDFPTYAEAEEYGDERFGEDGYVIESVKGEVV